MGRTMLRMAGLILHPQPVQGQRALRVWLEGLLREWGGGQMEIRPWKQNILSGVSWGEG